MGLEIKSVLKNKVSAVIFFILLVLNMVQVPNYMGHEYDVEQNMNIFETRLILNKMRKRLKNEVKCKILEFPKNRR